MAVNDITRATALEATADRSTTQRRFRQGIEQVVSKADATPTDLTVEIAGTEYGITRGTVHEDEWTLTLPESLPSGDEETWTRYGTVITDRDDGGELAPADPVRILPSIGRPNNPEDVVTRPDPDDGEVEEDTYTRRISANVRFAQDAQFAFIPGASESGQDTLMILPGYYDDLNPAWNVEVPTSYLYLQNISRLTSRSNAPAGWRVFQAMGPHVTAWLRQSFPRFPTAELNGDGGGHGGSAQFVNMPLNFFDALNAFTVVIFRRRQRNGRPVYQPSPPGHMFAVDRATTGQQRYTHAGVSYWVSFDFSRGLWSGSQELAAGGGNIDRTESNQPLPRSAITYNTEEITTDTIIYPTLLSAREIRNAFTPIISDPTLVDSRDDLAPLETNAGRLARITGRGVETVNGSQILAGFRVFNGVDQWF